jgi:hypothetical protein
MRRFRRESGIDAENKLIAVSKALNLYDPNAAPLLPKSASIDTIAAD